MTHPYAREDYARSLGHVGEVFAVPEWGGHVLVRATPEGGRQDAIGPYPITVLPATADLQGGLARLRDAGLVSVVLVLEDRLKPPLEALEAAFDTVRAFKSHCVFDRSLGPLEYAKHHRYEVRRAHGRVRASEIRLADHLPAWQALYAELSARHGLGGLHAFPTAHHERLAELPGVRTFGAFIEERLVAAHVFVTDAGHAMSHLAASAPEGYANGAAYAVNDVAIAGLADCQVVNLGGGAGAGDDPSDGLVRFKKGFANSAAPSWLCGAVLDPEAYATLSAGRREGFFPAYRAPPAAEPA